MVTNLQMPVLRNSAICIDLILYETIVFNYKLGNGVYIMGTKENFNQAIHEVFPFY